MEGAHHHSLPLHGGLQRQVRITGHGFTRKAEVWLANQLEPGVPLLAVPLVNDGVSSQVSGAGQPAALSQQCRAENRAVNDVQQPMGIQTLPITDAPIHRDSGYQLLGIGDAGAVVQYQLNVGV